MPRAVKTVSGVKAISGHMKTGVVLMCCFMALACYTLILQSRQIEDDTIRTRAGSTESFLRHKVVRPLLRDHLSFSGKAPRQKGKELWEGRRSMVVDAMKHAWGGYVKAAWGHDELDLEDSVGKDNFGSVGATIVDSLDTLWLMGLKEEFKAARDWTADELNFNRDHDSSVFESTIRIVGGLLAAHDLSGDEMFARRAQEMGDILMEAFHTPTGIPKGTINFKTGHAYNPTWTWGASGLAEFGTDQIEYIKLSAYTGNATYARLAEGAVALMHHLHPDKGLLPSLVSPEDGSLVSDHITFGAMGDSYYEYLLKVWLLKGRSDDMYRDMWVAAMDEMIERLVLYSIPSGMAYVAEFKSGDLVHKMDHLACFLPGVLALGASHGAVTGTKAVQYMTLAHNMTSTCYEMYARQETGLAPEVTLFGGTQEMTPGPRHNLLRPETVEALFVMWRTTREPIYREWGWNIFQAFEMHCRVEGGYAGVRDVTQLPVENDSTMQSFFLAETLKYLFLLFGPDDVLPLDEYVFNTEAHPLRKVPGFKSSYHRKAANKSRPHERKKKEMDGEKF